MLCACEVFLMLRKEEEMSEGKCFSITYFEFFLNKKKVILLKIYKVIHIIYIFCFQNIRVQNLYIFTLKFKGFFSL